MRKLRIVAAVAIALTAAIGACGGKVVVDNGSGNAGGAGTAGGDHGGFGGLGGAGGASCFDPPDPATLTFCSGAVSSSGGVVQCENDWCDDHGNTYRAVCTSKSCQCFFNTEVQCLCALDGPGNFCVATPTCCPYPGSLK